MKTYKEIEEEASNSFLNTKIENKLKWKNSKK